MIEPRIQRLLLADVLRWFVSATRLGDPPQRPLAERDFRALGFGRNALVRTRCGLVDLPVGAVINGTGQCGAMPVPASRIAVLTLSLPLLGALPDEEAPTVGLDIAGSAVLVAALAAVFAFLARDSIAGTAPALFIRASPVTSRRLSTAPAGATSATRPPAAPMAEES